MLDNFDIIELNDVIFDEYKGRFEKYRNNNDGQEIRFQEIVQKFISVICNNLDVEDCRIKGRKSSKHDYFQYCGSYINEKGVKQAFTPDLVIAQNWNWLNEENVVDYRAVVEVKSPFGKESIYHKDYKDYSEDLKNQLKSHLSAIKNSKVILTDTMKWEFYEKSNGLVPIQIYKLYDLFGRRWEWKKGEKLILKDDVTKELFENGLEYISPVKEFEELKKFMIKFLGKED